MDVLVCDDHPIVASAIAMMIESAFDATVHITHSYRDALALAARKPAIALCLLDIHIPGEDARTGVQALQGALTETRLVLFSGSDDDEDQMLALDLGMHGFLPKSSSPEVVDAALRLVLAGGVYLPRSIGELAMRHGRTARAGTDGAPEPKPAIIPPGSAEALFGNLTERQRTVLQHVSSGRSNKEIARDLAISPATVKAHVAQIIAVLGASNRTEASAKARSLGLIDLD